MNQSAPDAATHCLEVRDARASSVIVHRVPPECAEAFLDWERNISLAAHGFPGYRGTEIYPPTGGNPAEWVVILHYDDAENLQRWIDSPVRAEWSAKLPRGLGDFRIKNLPSGFGPWFAAQLDDPGVTPPPWKMAVTVLMGLYPTVMLLSILVMPSMSRLGIAASMFVGNALSVSILQWGVMPLLEPLLRPWLGAKASTADARWATRLAPALIVIVLIGQVLLFRLIAG